MLTSSKIKELARAVGFDLCGVASALPDPADTARYGDWIAQGRHAEMAYMARNEAARADPQLILEGARSIICCALLYNTMAPRSMDDALAGRAWISRYAWGDDYHGVMRRMLKDLARSIAQAAASSKVRMRACVDTAPLPERSLAARGGLGWIGRNGALINEQLGSFLFLGELLTDLELDADRPVENLCGECDLCVQACPGQAFMAPSVVDACRCASYMTVEHKGPFGGRYNTAALTRNVFGCDICQDVCPWNHQAPATDRQEFQPRPGSVNPGFDELTSLSEEEFHRRFGDSPLERRGLDGLLRNTEAARRNQP